MVSFKLCQKLMEVLEHSFSPTCQNQKMSHPDTGDTNDTTNLETEDKSNSEEVHSVSCCFTDSSSSSQSKSTCLVSKPHVSTPVSILIESLVKNICSIYETDPKKASMMYTIICDKLFRMNLIDESFSMAEFESMRNEYQRAFIHLVTSVKSGDKNLPVRPIWPAVDVNCSHYLREFDEVEYIAGGGFGQVFKVKHKLDGTEYAVKKIPIHSEGIESVKNYLSEVKTFASMNHSNIVQYKAAWLEMGPPNKANSALKDVKDGTSFAQKPKFKMKEKYHPTEVTEYIYHKDLTDSFTDDKGLLEEDTSDFEINFEHSISGSISFQKTSFSSTSKQRREKKHSCSEGDMAVCKLGMQEIEKIRVINKTKQVMWATLYIQMALCHSTLKHWLEKRNQVPEPNKAVVPINDQIVRSNTVKQILVQILRGLEYIHSKGIVHHDIKPSNIFIQVENGSLLIQLGDFGLACPLQSVRHSLAFGTKLYAAPEQLAGKCDPKSDMYSVGIVLFELVENFNTDMERVHNISELRKGHLPSSLLTKQPDLAQMINRLIQKKPSQRPEARELLQSFQATESDQIEILKSQLAEKDEEILHLKELLKSHGIKSM